MTLRALVTNDDGIDFEGIRHLAMAARDAGLDVLVAAPAHEASGSGAALQAVQSEGKVLIDERALEGLDGVPCYAVDASPAFISRLAIRGAFGDRPDVVIAGINRGANTGRAVVHSGTVGAAVSGYTSGVRGLAVSLRGDEPTHWATATAVAGRVIPYFINIAEPCVLNLNVPDLELDEVLGLRAARLAAFGTVQTTVIESGLGYVKIGLGETGHEPEPDSDVALLTAGYATLTYVVPMCERPLTGLPELDEVMQTAG
ncbi:MAG: 5'/3'-nucleotidase SurE [Candidatus Dormibacteraeota bacterium]|nr:5'/3'-nucleotidase SurE [Candidatus Dormibacteraeota bacterium]